MSNIRLVIYCLCLGVAGGAILRRRNPPCFHRKSSDHGMKQNLNQLVAKINATIFNFVSNVDDFKKNMADYCVNEIDLDGISFIDVSKEETEARKVIFQQNFCQNTKLFLKEIHLHYDTLNLLASYVDKLKRATKDTARDNLRTFQKAIYSCMCSQKIALRSHHHDPIAAVPRGDLSWEFVQLLKISETRCEQQQLQYVIAMDSQRIANYLKTMYSVFDGTSSVICD